MIFLAELKRRNVIRVIAFVGGHSRPECFIENSVGPGRPSYGKFNEIFK